MGLNDSLHQGGQSVRRNYALLHVILPPHYCWKSMGSLPAGLGEFRGCAQKRLWHPNPEVLG